MISFTGSTAVGQKIAQLTASSMKKVSLELGGKNAAVVFNDANIDESVAGVTRSAFLNQGEFSSKARSMKHSLRSLLQVLRN